MDSADSNGKIFFAFTIGCNNPEETIISEFAMKCDTALSEMRSQQIQLPIFGGSFLTKYQGLYEKILNQLFTPIQKKNFIIELNLFLQEKK